jgi:hypothetical protein
MNTLAIGRVNQNVFCVSVAKSNDVADAGPNGRAKSKCSPRFVPTMGVLKIVNEPPIENWRILFEE